jgi:plasmid stability protein
MGTLYVRDVPEYVLENLRARAQRHGRSVSAEVIADLKLNVDSPEVRAQRREVFEQALADSHLYTAPPGTPTAEEMIREDRER